MLLDLDWLARGRGGACRIANVTTWVQYKIVFLQILVSLASHRGVSIFTCARCYNNALISLVYNLLNEYMFLYTNSISSIIYITTI